MTDNKPTPDQELERVAGTPEPGRCAMSPAMLALLIASVIVGWLLVAVPAAVVTARAIRRREAEPTPPENTEEVAGDEH